MVCYTHSLMFRKPIETSGIFPSFSFHGFGPCSPKVARPVHCVKCWRLTFKREPRVLLRLVFLASPNQKSHSEGDSVLSYGLFFHCQNANLYILCFLRLRICYQKFPKQHIIIDLHSRYRFLYRLVRYKFLYPLVVLNRLLLTQDSPSCLNGRCVKSILHVRILFPSFINFCVGRLICSVDWKKEVKQVVMSIHHNDPRLHFRDFQAVWIEIKKKSDKDPCLKRVLSFVYSLASRHKKTIHSFLQYCIDTTLALLFSYA